MNTTNPIPHLIQASFALDRALHALSLLPATDNHAADAIRQDTREHAAEISALIRIIRDNAWSAGMTGTEMPARAERLDIFLDHLARLHADEEFGAGSLPG